MSKTRYVDDEAQAHFESCATCRANDATWRDIEDRLHGWGKETQAAAAHPAELARLMAKVQRRDRPRRRWTSTFGPTMAGVCVIVALWIASDLGLFRASKPLSSGRDARVVLLRGRLGTSGPRNGSDAVLSSVDDRLLVRIETGATRDTVALGNLSTAVVRAATASTVRLELVAGTLACAVGRRAEKQQLVVTSGRVSATALGTRFGLGRDEAGTVSVAVGEGSVAVQSAPGEQVRVVAGESVAVDARGNVQRTLSSEMAARLERLMQELTPALRTTPQVPAPPTSHVQPTPSVPRRAGPLTADLPSWREWVMDGQLERAERALGAHLARRPGDVQAWSLLGDCHRKAEQWLGAITAYDQVIKRGSAAEANRARYLAAVVAQDALGDHARAVRLLGDYLDSQPGLRPLEADAQLRLAISLRALRRDNEANALLQRLTTNHPTSAAARRALELLRPGDGDQ